MLLLLNDAGQAIQLGNNRLLLCDGRVWYQRVVKILFDNMSHRGPVCVLFHFGKLAFNGIAKEMLVNRALVKDYLEDVLVKVCILSFPLIGSQTCRPRDEDITLPNHILLRNRSRVMVIGRFRIVQVLYPDNWQACLRPSFWLERITIYEGCGFSQFDSACHRLQKLGTELCKSLADFTFKGIYTAKDDIRLLVLNDLTLNLLVLIH